MSAAEIFCVRRCMTGSFAGMCMAMTGDETDGISCVSA